MNPAQIEVWVIPLDAGLFPAAESLLSPDERALMHRLVRPEDQRRFCRRRAARRQLLAARSGVAPERLEFVAGPFGKPALQPPAAQIAPEFSCSCSHDTALVAITHAGSIGVDLEQHRPLGADLSRMAEFFSRDEQAMLMRLTGGERERAFFDCWSRKEAVLKSLGCGLAQPLDSFSVSLAPDAPVVRNFGGDVTAASRWTLADLTVGPGYSATLAAQFPVNAVLKDWHDFRPAD